MSTEPRVALDTLITALERHLEACAGKRGDTDAAVDRAYMHLADAFEAYDDALFAAYDETTPLVLDTEEDDEYDDEDYEDEDDEAYDEDEDTLVDDEDDYDDDVEFDEDEETAGAGSEGGSAR